PLTYTRVYFYEPATTKLYTLSLHDALPILERQVEHLQRLANTKQTEPVKIGDRQIKGFLRDPESSDLEIHNHEHPGYPRLLFTLDRKSTRLNSSHVKISYAVFSLKKKNKKK